MPGLLFCVFGPSNFPAAAILNYDVVVHCRAQANLCKAVKNGDQRKFSAESFRRMCLIDPIPSIPEFQNYLLISRTINYLVKSNDWGERYNSVVFFI